MDDHPLIRAFTTAAVVIAATGAFFAAPILPYAHTGLVASFGLLLGVSSGLAWLAVRSAWSKWWDRSMVAAVVVSMIGLTWQITSAQDHYQANRLRCATIQRDMLMPNPRRADGPDLFQALDCQPQGIDDIQFPAPKPIAGQIRARR